MAGPRRACLQATLLALMVSASGCVAPLAVADQSGELGAAMGADTVADMGADMGAGTVAATERPISAPVSEWPLHDDSFEHYRNRASTWLTARSMGSRSRADIALNLPFEKKADSSVSYRGRFLLFHGLNDSPAVWHDFADALVARGFDVRVPLFAGHGSTPEDMLDVHQEAWVSAARLWLADWLPGATTAIDRRAEEVPTYLGGFSMGGVIATLLALDEPRISGLLLISPAYRSSLDRWLRFSGIYARFKPWVFGGMILEDNPIKYNSIPVNSGWQFFRLTRALMRRWRPADRIAVPALLVMSSEDSVVDVGYSRQLFRRRFTHARRHLLTYAPDVQAGDSPGTGDDFATLRALAQTHEEIRNSRFPESRVLGQSHLSLTNAPSNPLFGENGSVLVCNGNEYPVFMACMRARGHWFGAQHTPSPDGVPVARVTWNPDWNQVLRRFDQVFPADIAVESAAR